jgi:hypothetical protein
MCCTECKDDWVAALCNELDDESAHAHLGACAACRATLACLDETRAHLRMGEPAVPGEVAAPRVVVLRAPDRRGARWASLAAAVLVFGGGLWLGWRLPRVEPAPETIAADAAETAWIARMEAVEQRIGSLESSSRTYLAAAPAAGITRDELQTEMSALERRLAVSRARDLEFLLGEIEATEMRAANWVEQTRDGLRYVALASNAGVSER